MTKENIQQYLPENVEVKIEGNAAVFEVTASQIKEIAADFHGKNLPLKLVTATDERVENGCFKIWYVFGVPKENMFLIPFIQLKNTTKFPSITSVAHSAWNHERKIQTFFGLTPVGHPDSRAIILHENWPENIFPLRKDFDWQTRPKDAKGEYQFQKVEGEGIYEIPVGPIHAGIIEPGHFRFSVAGESIVLLEPRLGFTHKGSEKLFEILSMNDKLRLSEKISGDSSFSHSLAFCLAVEQLNNTAIPDRANYLRVIYAELERLANHFGDIGAIMVDTGFNFGGANGARLREMVMQINEEITGSRFLRGVNIIGGVTKDISNEKNARLQKDFANILKDFNEVIAIAENSSSLLNRLENTGVLSYEVAEDHDVTGVPGKAAGMANDARTDYPYSGYKKISIGVVPTEQKGDVYARFNIRVKEARASINIILESLKNLKEGAINLPRIKISLKKNAVAISVVEGWRGEIVYFVKTDNRGNISRVAPRDPSFVNWPVVGNAGFDNVVPDFPLINKSFNLSYSGNDL